MTAEALPHMRRLQALARDEAAIRELMRQRLEDGVTLGDLAERYCCSRAEIDQVIRHYAQQCGPAARRAGTNEVPPSRVEHSCRRCGREIVGRTRSAKLCLVCLAERGRERSRAQYMRRRQMQAGLGERRCVVCGGDISRRHGRAKYCRGCASEADRQWRRRYIAEVSRWRARQWTGHRCRQCGADISSRHRSARRCVGCAHARQRALGRQWKALHRGSGRRAPERPRCVECQECGVGLVVHKTGQVPAMCPRCRCRLWARRQSAAMCAARDNK